MANDWYLSKYGGSKYWFLKLDVGVKLFLVGKTR